MWCEFVDLFLSITCCGSAAVVITVSCQWRSPWAPDAAQVEFEPIPEDVIDKIVAEGDVLHCAGACAFSASASVST